MLQNLADQVQEIFGSSCCMHARTCTHTHWLNSQLQHRYYTSILIYGWSQIGEKRENNLLRNVWRYTVVEGTKLEPCHLDIEP